VLRRLELGERLGPDVRFFDERRSGDRRARGLMVRLLTRPGGTGGAAHRLGDVVSYGMIEASGHYEGGPEMLRGPEGEGDNPSFLGTVGIVHDITLNRRSEEMMRIFLQAADQSPVSLLVTNAAGAVEYANPPFLRSAGLEPDQVMGRSMTNLTESQRLGPLFRIVADAVQAGNDWRGRLPGKKGVLPWTHLTLNAVRDPQNRPTHYIAILTGE